LRRRSSARPRTSSASSRPPPTYATTAPRPVWSSNDERQPLSRAGNRQLNAAVHRDHPGPDHTRAPENQSPTARQAATAAWKPSASSSDAYPTSSTSCANRRRPLAGSVHLTEEQWTVPGHTATAERYAPCNASWSKFVTSTESCRRLGSGRLAHYRLDHEGRQQTQRRRPPRTQRRPRPLRRPRRPSPSWFMASTSLSVNDAAPNCRHGSTRQSRPLSQRSTAAAAGLLSDFDAVTNGLTQLWNSGPAEGHVNRIKMMSSSRGHRSPRLSRNRT